MYLQHWRKGARLTRMYIGGHAITSVWPVNKSWRTEFPAPACDCNKCIIASLSLFTYLSAHVAPLVAGQTQSRAETEWWL